MFAAEENQLQALPVLERPVLRDGSLHRLSGIKRKHEDITIYSFGQNDRVSL